MSGTAGPLLAFDTSTNVAAVAVGAGARVLAGRVLEAASRASSELLPVIDEVVRIAGVDRLDVGAVVVGAGPGSFTGVRIAAATAKGLVAALEVPLLAYGSLLAWAAAHHGAGRPVCALFDARNRDVYAGCWSFADGVDGRLAPIALPLDEVLERARSFGSPLFVGPGAEMHRGEIEAAFGAGSVASGGTESPAEALLWLAATAPELGRVDDAAAWEPEYLRASGAERIAAARGAA